MRGNRSAARLTATALLTLAAAVLLGVAAPQPAAASTWSRELLNTQVVADGARTPLVSLGTMAMEGGTTRHLSAQYTAEHGESFNIMQAARIRCRRTSDDAAFYSTYTTRNVVAGAVSTARTRWMFDVPTSDDYACTLWGHAATSRGQDYQLEVTSGAIGIDAADYSDGAEWRHTSGGTVEAGQASYLMRKTWTAERGARVGADAGVELTNEYGSPNNGQTATAEVRLYVTQLNASGTGCRPADVVVEHFEITSDVHHDKVHLRLRDVPVSDAPGCEPRFAIKTLVKNTADNPITLEGSAGSHYSSTMAFSY